MGKHFGWWVDLTKVTLADAAGTKTSWVHALPYGTYTHPIHGSLVFDSAKLTALATSVKTKVRGVDPDIDYDHKTDPAKGGQAAGWVKDADVRSDGLWLHVDWTADGAKDIMEKKYRYFSADYADEWTDPNGVVHTDVLNGGGLTNRPYMKNLIPVNLSELVVPPNDPPGETDMDLKKLRELLGLAETADEAAVIAKLTEMATSITTLTAEKTTLTEEVAKLKNPTDPKLDPQLRQLIESSPAFAKLFADNEAKEKALQEAQAAIRLAEINTKLAELQHGKTFALTPPTREAIQQVMLKSGPEAAKLLFELFEGIVNGTSLVDLSERGYTRQHSGDGTDSSARFNEQVKALMEKDKLDYGTAVERVARDNPKLFDEYRESSYTFKA
jgi:hypothetical protein